jgi:hypothetical protein
MIVLKSADSYLSGTKERRTWTKAARIILKDKPIKSNDHRPDFLLLHFPLLKVRPSSPALR